MKNDDRTNRLRLIGYRLVGLMLLAGVICSIGHATTPILPTPQFYEPLDYGLSITSRDYISIEIGPASNAGNEKIRLAAAFLTREIAEVAPSVRVDILTSGETVSKPKVVLWHYAADSNPGVELNFPDRQTLKDASHYGQSYVIRTPDNNSLWIIGSTEQGVLFGAMSALQLIAKQDDGLEISGANIRDYPDF